MANELETSSFNFSIVDSMEMGTGNQSLIDDLYSETVTAKTDDIKKIDTEKKEDKKPNPTDKKKDKEEGKKEDDKDKIDPTKTFDDFLNDDGNDPEGKKKEDDKDSDNDPDKKDENKEGEGTDEDNTFKSLSKDLFKLGVFSKDEEEGDEVDINTPEEFLERFHYEIKKGATGIIDRFIGQFGQEYQDAFDAIYVKGVDPKEYFGTFNTIQDFSTLDIKDEVNQEAIVRQGYLELGMAPEDIKAKIEKVKSYGDLEDEAQRLHKVLIKKEQTKLEKLKQDSEQKTKQAAANKGQYVKNVQTVLQDKLKTGGFDGIPLNPKLATELQDFLVTDKYKTPSGETLTEFDRTILDLKRPENHEKKVKLALLIKILETDPTLSTIQKAGITKKTDALFGEVARQKTKTPMKSDKIDKPTSWFS